MDDISRIAPPFDLLSTASTAELEWIACLGKPGDHSRHRDALDALIHTQQGRLREDQLWFPYEVIERGAAQCDYGHEREFVVCTLLLFLAAGAPATAELALDLEQHFQDHAMAYEALPDVLRDTVMEAFEVTCG